MRNSTGTGLNRQWLTFGAVLLVLLTACTSSNTPTSGLSTGNTNFDSNYRDQTRSAGTYADGETKPVSTEPVYTLMALGTETGDIYPGEEYAVFAVADAPDRRGNMEYVWSCTNGTLDELPEADRGRVQTLVEQEDIAIRAMPQGGTQDAPAPADGSVPAPAEGPPASADGTAVPPAAPVLPAPTPVPGPVGVPGVAGAKQPGQYTVADLPTAQQTYPENIKALLVRQLNSETLSTEELETLNNYRTQVPGGQASLSQRRFVGAPAAAGPARVEEDFEATSGPVEGDDAKELADKALQAAREELDRFRGEPAGAANVADSTASGADFSDDEDFTAPTARSLRDEYGNWADDSSEVNRRNLGGGGNADADEPLLAEESYLESSFTTDQPYVMWTPSAPGPTRIYCKLVWKEVNLTDPVALEADVTLREPKVDISTEFPDIIREDEDVLIRLDGDNLPDFKKGLFTLEYDPDVLSFRSAELGEFFDDAPSASIYYAEPDKQSGKALLALDSNTEITELSGAGPLAYVKFKAKRDIESQEDTKLAMVVDSSARYVLDHDGDNVLPAPIEREPLRSQITVPPVQIDTTREPAPLTTPPAGGSTPLASGTLGDPSATALMPNNGSPAAAAAQRQQTTGPVLPPAPTPDLVKTPIKLGSEAEGSGTSDDDPGATPPVVPGTDVIGPVPPAKVLTPEEETEATEDEAGKPGINGRSN